MQVNILCREPEAALSISSAVASNTVRAVLKQFCKHLSITERHCQLFCDDVPLSVEQKLSQVPGSSSGVIHLLARIQPSVALYHWQLFHQASLCNTCNYSAVWQAATEQFIHAYTYHEQQLPPPQDIAAFNATSRMLLPLHCPPSSDRATPVLPTALAPVRPLFQLTQILLSQVPSVTPQACTASKAASSSEPDNVQQTKSGVNPVASGPAKEVAMLQTLLLVLKLISLVTAVASPSVSATTAVMVLWEILTKTLKTLRCIQCKPGWSEGSLDSVCSEHPSHSEGWLDSVVALTKMLMTQLRQCLVRDGMSEQAQLCCTTLTSLLDFPRMKRSYSMAVAMAAAIKDPAFGGLAVVVSGLKKCNGAQADKQARTTVQLLDVLCSTHNLTADSVEQHLKLLAQMQTAVHLSGLFCPILDKGDGPMKLQAQCLFENKFIREAAADHMPSAIERMVAIMPLVHLTRRLLAMDRESQPDSQGFTQRMELPLPEATALWQGREKIALRAFFLLDCVQGWLAPGGSDAHLTLPRSALMQQDISSLLIQHIVQTLHECLAGHLLDPRLDVRLVFSRSFNGVMYAWAQREGDILDDLHSLGTMFLQRLVSQYKVLLHGTFAGLDKSNLLVRPLVVAAVWSMIFERFKEGQMGTVASAMEALHALVCHTTYCSQLMGRGCLPMLLCFKPLLLALRPFPAAQLTFGASLACLAEVGSDLCEASPDSAQEDSTAKAGSSVLVSSIRQNHTLDAICGCLQDASLLPMPWTTEHIISLARVLQRMAILCRQQPQLVSPIIKEAQASVLQRVLRLLPDLHPTQREAQQDLLIGALLFSGLPFKKPFSQDADSSQDVIDSLTGLLNSYSLLTDTASSASNTASTAAAASCTDDASSLSDAQQPTSSEHAQTAPQALQASMHTELTQAAGDEHRVFGLIQHSDIEIQPMILSSLLACLPQQHVISDAVFADCENWFIQVAENLFLMGQQEEPWLAIPCIPYYTSMMFHMEWGSKRKVSARLSQACIQVLLLLLPALKYRHEENKGKAHASRSLGSADKARNMSKARLFEDPQERLVKNLGVITGPKPLPGSVSTDQHGNLNLMDEPMQLCVEHVDEIMELIGLLLLCMQHMQEDADWQLAVAVDFPGSKKWQAQLPAIMKLLSPVLPSAYMRKLSCYFEPLLNFHADAAAADAAAEQLVEDEEQAAAVAVAKAAAKKAKKQRQKLKKNTASPEPQHNIDSGQSTASGQQSPESSALHSMGALSEQLPGEAVETPSLPAADQTAVSQTSAAFLLNLFRCPLSKVNMSDPVVAADGHTYERAAITSWLQQHTTSPVTKQPLPHMRIFSNQLAKAAIANRHAL